MQEEKVEQPAHLIIDPPTRQIRKRLKKRPLRDKDAPCSYAAGLFAFLIISTTAVIGEMYIYPSIVDSYLNPSRQFNQELSWVDSTIELDDAAKAAHEEFVKATDKAKLKAAASAATPEAESLQETDTLTLPELTPPE